jgi:pilus assembly protein Flp/PilA
MFFLRPNNQKGQDIIEFAALLVLIAIVVMAVLMLIGPEIGNIFSNIVEFSDSLN